MNILFECPNCEWLIDKDNKIICNGNTLKCLHCKKTIVIELHIAQDEEDMESE